MRTATALLALAVVAALVGVLTWPEPSEGPAEPRPREPTTARKAIWGPVLHLHLGVHAPDRPAQLRPQRPRRPSDPEGQRLDAAIAHSSDRIHTLGWFRLRDQPPNDRGDQANWGLIDDEGRRKPAFDVFARAE